ncbi:MAG: avidin/streptavidin family protein [Candidatus Acidiferrales bacterium]|jgi:hypothetical protein
MKHAELAYFKTATLPPSKIDFNGQWENELGSYMDLKVTGTNLRGTYVSAVSDSGGKTKPFHLKGSVAGDLLTFSVNWGKAVTAWTGHGVINNGHPQILTLWQLVVTIQNELDPKKQWKTIMAGADEFVPIRKKNPR